MADRPVYCCRGCGRDTTNPSRVCDTCRAAKADRDDRDRLEYLRHRGEEPYRRDVEEDR